VREIYNPNILKLKNEAEMKTTDIFI